VVSARLTARSERAEDYVLPFQIEGAGIRGRLVRLQAVLDDINGRHDYPKPVAMLQAEALVLAAMLASGLKFEGTFSLQTKSDGPVSRLIADYRTPGLLRGYARFDADKLPAGARTRGSSRLARLLGGGHLAFTVDQGEDTESYQGIVELIGANLSECVQRYFQQSEQIGTGIRLAVKGAGKTGWFASGLLLQRLPGQPLDLAGDDQAEDRWRTVLAVLGSTRDDELLDRGLRPEDLLWRLFHAQGGGVRVWRPILLRPACTCSRARAERVLRSFPVAEREPMVVDGRILVTCKFCNACYDFAADELVAVGS
jgi:molecular chaperone Hsp33